MFKRLCFACLFCFLLVFFAFSVSAIDLSCKAGALVDGFDGEILFEKNADMTLPMASTTKIMTAIIAIENCELDKIIEIPSEATEIEGSSIYLKAGEMLTVRELLYALMLESANDASVALAYATCGNLDDFVSLMNKKASELGLKNTNFENTHGLDSDEHYTTAYELASLACYAMKNPIFKEIASTKKMIIPLNNGEGTRVLVNHNKLLRSYDGAIGIKTGYTKKCGRCLVSCAERDGARLVCVTLNAPNDWQDHKKMLDFGFSKYKAYNLAESGDYVLSLDVINGTSPSVLATNLDSLSISLRDENASISAVFECDRLLSAPIMQNQEVGRIVFYNYDKEIASLPLYSLETVSKISYKKSILERLLELWKK